MPHQTLRIIDANCNRISEGLRVLEDIARFILNNQPLNHQLKALRHDLVKGLTSLGAGLITARDTDTDVGTAGIHTSTQADLAALVAANAKRVEEALRVVEEMAKLPEISRQLDSRTFETARFTLYALEKELLSRLLRRDKVSRLRGLYVIIDAETLGYRDETKVAAQAISGGASTIQLRDKKRSKRELLHLAREINELCRNSNTLFIINDHLDIALVVECDGLHIGQEDLPISLIRRELQVEKLIGISTRTTEQAAEAQAQGADYIAVGSIYTSPTKPDAPVIGLAELRKIRQVVNLPIVAIGGINRENIRDVMATGVEAAAVISAVITQEDIERATRILVKEIGATKSHLES